MGFSNLQSPSSTRFLLVRVDQQWNSLPVSPLRNSDEGLWICDRAGRDLATFSSLDQGAGEDLVWPRVNPVHILKGYCLSLAGKGLSSSQVLIHAVAWGLPQCLQGLLGRQHPWNSAENACVLQNHGRTCKCLHFCDGCTGFNFSSEIFMITNLSLHWNTKWPQHKIIFEELHVFRKLAWKIQKARTKCSFLNCLPHSLRSRLRIRNKISWD